MLPLTDFGLAGDAALLDDRLVGRCRCSNWRSSGDGRRMFDGCILCVHRRRYGQHRRGAPYAGQNTVSHLCVTRVLRLGGRSGYAHSASAEREMGCGVERRGASLQGRQRIDGTRQRQKLKAAGAMRWRRLRDDAVVSTFAGSSLARRRRRAPRRTAFSFGSIRGNCGPIIGTAPTFRVQISNRCG